MHSKSSIAKALATALLAGRFEREGMVDRAERLFGRRWRWMPSLVDRLVAKFPSSKPPKVRALVDFIVHDSGFSRAHRRSRILIAERLGFQPVMSPGPHQDWWIPELSTAGQLADWLGINVGEVDWFADCQGLERVTKRPKARHYHYRFLGKRFGRYRVIESPKPRLKSMQRKILRNILNQVPPHEVAHGFRGGRSIMTFAAPHQSQRAVLKIDLQDFFPSISFARVRAVFRAIGYPDEVAVLLTGLCTNQTPADVWGHWNRRKDWQEQSAEARYAVPHLPQGAPTSPALANLVAYHLDCRLKGLADRVGARFTRYADDLAFSGGQEFDRQASRLIATVSRIARDEGFDVNHHKTRLMRQSSQQRIAGLVVNEHLNFSRLDYDRLKATLTNCVRRGPATQNRDGVPDFRQHLEGRVAYVLSINSARGQKLRQIFDAIDWSR